MLEPAQIAQLAALRRDLHTHPELAFSEYRTAALLAERLEALDLPVQRDIGGTGLVATVRGARPGPAIGLRADMDALPMHEGNTFAHASQRPGCMHGCGHDGHSAMLLGAAQALAAERDFAGTVYLIFQPAEEMEGGALAMIGDGLFTRFPMQAVYGLHNWPGLPAGHIAVHAGPMMAGMDLFEIVITGRGSHAAMPHEGNDALVAAAQLVTAIQTIASRTVSPLESAVVSVTQLHAGDAYNVIPEQVVVRGTCRYFNPKVQTAIRQRLDGLCRGLDLAFDVEARLDYRVRYPAVNNTAAHAAIAAGAAAQALGEDKVIRDFMPSMASEDFAAMLAEVPGALVWLGADGDTPGAPLHNPGYDFNDALIGPGVSFWVTLARRALEAAA
ncbi:M20 aminoacylase family protein [Craterilacuibacter sinensis]|uniref:Amidohydrolase n=1 Tax=Craterilacuibacter sinensis TaxID=2686017 RepID=A0A845BVG5_9NEIS|nr:M20 aminoacylase family protein [Craterilacuibacter sinensis]MXR36503.1 amidohydrolase [Craterilacuibacter sinensis]